MRETRDALTLTDACARRLRALAEDDARKEILGYAEARESYRPVEEVLHASIDRSGVSTGGSFPAGRVAAYASCVAFAPAVLAASRALQKHF